MSKKSIRIGKKKIQYSNQTPKRDEGVLSPVRKRDDVELIVGADLHLCHTPPVFRSVEPDWYEAMKRTINQIWEIKDQCRAPFVLCGDLFHRWNPPPELINFALEYLPDMYVLPGQHDLPYHDYDQMHRSAFGTLFLGCDKFKLLLPGYPTQVGGLNLHSFPWGKEIIPVKEKSSLVKDVAIVHSFIWTEKTKYEGAPEDQSLSSYRSKLKTYDYAFFGDNHKPFASFGKTPFIVNCGSLMRRNIDQIDHKPRVWLLKRDGEVEIHYLDVSQDRTLDRKEFLKITVNGQSMKDFLGKVKDLQSVAISFEDAVDRYMSKHKVEKDVRKIIIAAIEDSKNGN